MTDPKVEKMFAEVLRKTREGKLKWHETAKEATFITAIAGRFTVEISKPEFDHAWDVTFSVRDVGDRELINFSTLSDPSAHNALAELYDLAKHRALRVDDKVDELLVALGKLA